MIRVVIDTNIFISGLVFGGLPRTVLQLSEEGAFTLVVVAPIQEEVKRILSEKFQWSEKEVAHALKKLWRTSRIVNPKVKLTICQDPDDDRVLECAVEAGADFVVSGDRHLLKLRKFHNIAIVTAREFVQGKVWKKLND